LNELAERLQRLSEFQRRLLESRLVASSPGAEPDKRLVAYVVPRAGTVADPRALRTYLARRLPVHMVPTAWVSLTALPLTPNGKVNHRRLQRGDRISSGAARELLAPNTEEEEKITAIWRAILGVDKVGTEDNFFDLGGHSLLMVRLQGRLQEALGTEISIMDLFRFPTVRSFAKHLIGTETASRSVLPKEDSASLMEERIRKQRQAVAGQRRIREDRRAKNE
jgi:acyl carrier protein